MMEFKVIFSGKEKPQVLDRGFRLKLNKGPQGPLKTSYFTCVEKGCKARAATLGELTDLSLKYHHTEQHNHIADTSKNIVAETMYEFRENAKQNPDKTAKAVFEKLSVEAMNSVPTPDKANLAAHLPKFNSVKDQHYRQRKKLRPTLPKTIEEVDIPSYGDHAKTDRGHDFYRGRTPSFVEVFMSAVMILIAMAAVCLFLDGTFAICPFPFYQIVFLRAKVGQNIYTIATALLPNKQETRNFDKKMTFPFNTI